MRVGFCMIVFYSKLVVLILTVYETFQQTVTKTYFEDVPSSGANKYDVNVIFSSKCKSRGSFTADKVVRHQQIEINWN